MKRVHILLLFCIICMTASSQQVTFSVKNVSVKTAMQRFYKTTGYAFVYYSQDIDVRKKVTVDAKNESIESVVRQILKGQDVEFEISDKSILVRKANTPVQHDGIKKIKAAGQVLDADGVPIIGATVRMPGATTGVVTDLDGNFAITAPENSSLEFSYLGCKTVIVKASPRMLITLENTTTYLNEIVVVGYGEMKKSDLTGSITVVKAKDLADLSLSALNGLQGRVAGVDVTNGKVIVRGAASINGSDPMWIVDGVRGAAVPNMDDIETIEVLKDASSTAIYGVNGGGGVILVTTKKGKNSKIEFNGRASYTFRSIINKPHYLNTADYIAQKLATGYEKPEGAGWDDPASLPDVDWTDYIYQKSHGEDYRAQLSGGNDKMNFNTSAEFNKSIGRVTDNKSELGIFRYAGEYHPNKSLNITQIVNLQYQQYDPVKNLGNIDSHRMVPTMYSTDPVTGEYGAGPNGSYFSGPNQWAGLKSRHVSQRSYTADVNLQVQWRPIKGLSLNTILFGRITGNSDKEMQETVDIPNTTFRKIASLTKQTQVGNVVRASFTATYEKTLAQHFFKVMAGMESKRSHTDFTGAGISENADGGFPMQPWYNLGLATGDKTVSGTDKRTRELSYFGRLNYNFDNRYLLEASIRRDGYDNFGPNNRFGTFPAVSAGWNVINEKFMENYRGKLSNLKLRASYGQVGNNTVPQFLWDYGFSITNLYTSFADGSSQRSWQLSKMANRSIKWETITQSNIGIDFGFFDNKLYGTFEYYYKKTSDMLYRIYVAESSGFAWQAFYANVGEIQNKGWEFSIGWRDTWRDLKYSVDLNFSHNKNRVLKLSDDMNTIMKYPSTSVDFFDTAVFWTQKDHAMGEYVGYICDGIYQNAEQVAYYNSLSPDGTYQRATTAPGDLIFRDINGDGHITEDDMTVIGTPWPDLTIGSNINLSWRGIEVMMAFTGAFGLNIFNSAKFYNNQFVDDCNTTYDIMKRWAPENPSNTNPRVVRGDPSHNFYSISSYYVESGDYLKLKTLHVGYRFPKKLIDWSGMKGLKLYVNLTNPLIFSKYDGDPELGGGYLQRNESNTNPYSPQYRSYELGASVTF